MKTGDLVYKYTNSTSTVKDEMMVKHLNCRCNLYLIKQFYVRTEVCVTNLGQIVLTNVKSVESACVIGNSPPNICDVLTSVRHYSKPNQIVKSKYHFTQEKDSFVIPIQK